MICNISVFLNLVGGFWCRSSREKSLVESDTVPDMWETFSIVLITASYSCLMLQVSNSTHTKNQKFSESIMECLGD